MKCTSQDSGSFYFYIFPSAVKQTEIRTTPTSLCIAFQPGVPPLLYLLVNTSDKNIPEIKKTDQRKCLKKYSNVSVLQSCLKVATIGTMILVAVSLLKTRAASESWKPFLPLPFVKFFHLYMFKHTLVQTKILKSLKKILKSSVLFSFYHGLIKGADRWQVRGRAKGKKNLGLLKVHLLFSSKEPWLLCL